MGILNEQSSTAAQQQKSSQLKSGYAVPLFIEEKTLWTDDRMIGGSVEKCDVRHHDKEKTLSILNGICSDLFFRASDIESPEYHTIPDCAAPVPENRVQRSFPMPASKLHKKPLDLKYQKKKRRAPMRYGSESKIISHRQSSVDRISKVCRSH